MMLVRRFEEKSAQLYGKQKIKGFCHLYIGQEALVAAMKTALTSEDKVITAYRDHGHALALGITPNAVMAELYGKETGCSGGKGGSMHMFSKEHHFFGGHGIVGAQIPLGAGMALAEQYNGTKNVSVCYLAMGLHARELYTKHSIWLCYGSYLLYLFVRTMNMQWAPALQGLLICLIFTKSVLRMTCLATKLTV